jgi:hypothetical protein
MTPRPSLESDSATTLERELGPEGVVHVRLHAGELVVRGSDGTAVRVRDLDQRDLTDRFEVDAGTASLSVRPRAQLGELGLMLGGRRSSRIEVEMPRTATLVVQTIRADVSSSGLVGEQRLGTTSGELRIHDATGTINAQAVSGSLVVRSPAELDLSARTVSGSADVEAARFTRLALTTTSGHVRLAGALVGDGPFTLRTVSGDVQVRLSGSVRVEARTLTGHIRSDLARQPEGLPGPRRRPVILGTAGPLLSFESVSGGLWFGSPTPPSPPAPPMAPAAPDLAALEMAVPVPPPNGPMTPASEAQPDPGETERLDLLRALERGEIDVATAMEQLARLDGEPPAGPGPAAPSQFGGRT